MKFLKKKTSAFTLLELIVSMAIFSFMIVVMTSIVLNMARVSYNVDRRSDFLNQLENGTNIIINEMRNAEHMGLCSAGTGQTRSLFIVRKENPDTPSMARFFQLAIFNNRLVLNTLSNDPGSNSNCTPNGQVKYVTPTSMIVRGLSFSVTTDSNAANTIIFTSFEACDHPSIKNQIFNCDPNQNNNPYRYQFAITTRNF